MDFSSALELTFLDAVESTVGLSPTLYIYSGAKPASCDDADPSGELVAVALPADWMETASGGVKTIKGPWTGVIASSGTAQSFRLKKDGVTHIQGTVTVVGGGGDLVLVSPVLQAGQAVTINSWTLQYIVSTATASATLSGVTGKAVAAIADVVAPSPGKITTLGTGSLASYLTTIRSAMPEGLESANQRLGLPSGYAFFAGAVIWKNRYTLGITGGPYASADDGVYVQSLVSGVWSTVVPVSSEANVTAIPDQYGEWTPDRPASQRSYSHNVVVGDTLIQGYGLKIGFSLSSSTQAHAISNNTWVRLADNYTTTMAAREGAIVYDPSRDMLVRFVTGSATLVHTLTPGVPDATWQTVNIPAQPNWSVYAAFGYHPNEDRFVAVDPGDRDAVTGNNEWAYKNRVWAMDPSNMDAGWVEQTVVGTHAYNMPAPGLEFCPPKNCLACASYEEPNKIYYLTPTDTDTWTWSVETLSPKDISVSPWASYPYTRLRWAPTLNSFVCLKGTSAPTEVFTPAAAVLTDLDYIMWDGGDNPTGRLVTASQKMYNAKIPIHFKNVAATNTGGLKIYCDWIDKNLIEQGTTPWFSFICKPVTTAPASRTVENDAGLTALVTRQITGKNRPWLLRSDGVSSHSVNFGGRTSPYPFRLTVFTDEGEFDCPCTATVQIALSTAGTLDGREICTVQKPWHSVVYTQFDYSNVTGTVTGARLIVTQLPKTQSGDATIKVWELNPPAVPLGDRGLEPQLGIAADYVDDVGIENHPDVLFATDFSNIQAWPNGGWDSVIEDGGFRKALGGPGFEQIVMPNGRVAMRYGFKQMAPDSTNSTLLGGGSLSRELWTTMDTVSKPYAFPVDSPEEIYARFYVLLEDDWGDPGNGDGSILPYFDFHGTYKMGIGIGFRWGLYRATGDDRNGGDFQSVSGNGGQPPSGRVSYDTYTAYPAQYCMHGGSARGHADGSQWDGNPYDDLYTPKWYTYHVDQDTPGTKYYSGDNGYNHGFEAMIKRGQWHCIEQYIKMNSVDMTNADAYDNGEGRYDGVMRGWVDGVLAVEFNDVRFRHNPYFGIQNLWVVWLHGGKVPGNNITKDMHYQQTDVVVAKKYIGPRGVGAPTLPAWVPAPGEMVDLSPLITQSFASVVPSWYNPFYEKKILTDESGRAANPWWGEYGGIICHGGGHSATNSNGVYIFDLDGLKWVRANNPTDFGLGPLVAGVTDGNDQTHVHDQTSDDGWGEYEIDGQPGSFHSYDQLVVVPPSANDGGTYGSLLTVQRSAIGDAAILPVNARAAHIMKFDSTAQAASTWIRHSNAPSTYPTSGTAGFACAYDSKRNRVWIINAADSTNTFIVSYDLATKQYTQHNYLNFNGTPNYTVGRTISDGVGTNNGGSMHYDPVHDVLIHAGTPTTGFVNFCYLRPGNPAGGWTVPVLSNDGVPTPYKYSSPFGYCPHTNKWYVITYGDRDAVYEIQIPHDITHTWEVTRVPFVGASIPETVPGSVHWCRSKGWMWMPKVRCFVHVEDSTTVVAYRPYGT